MHMQNLVKIHAFVFKILSGNKILTSIKDHNSGIKLWILTHNNPKLDLVNISAYAKFGQIPSIRSQDIEWDGITTWRNDGQPETVYLHTHTLYAAGYNNTNVVGVHYLFLEKQEQRNA